MKKFIIILFSTYFIIAGSASAFVISSAALASLGAGVASQLVPILKPIAEKLIIKTATDIENLVLGKSCPSPCVNPIFLCKQKPITGTNVGASSCKKRCQKLKMVGGYTIRIRFGVEEDGTKWDLTKCVNDAVTSGSQIFSGKGDPRSIAIYSQEDLDKLLGLIALQMAARQIVDSKGASLSKEEKEQFSKEGKSIAEVIKESNELVSHIDASIKENVTSGTVYGPQ